MYTLTGCRSLVLSEGTVHVSVYLLKGIFKQGFSGYGDLDVLRQCHLLETMENNRNGQKSNVLVVVTEMW